MKTLKEQENKKPNFDLAEEAILRIADFIYAHMNLKQYRNFNFNFKPALEPWSTGVPVNKRQHRKFQSCCYKAPGGRAPKRCVYAFFVA